MMPRPPCTRLHRLLRRWLPAGVAADVLEPAVADLQYEAEHARTMIERRRVILRGYLAIVRSLVLSIEPGGAIRATLALSALCGAGALLVTTARAAHVDGRVLNSAMLAPGLLAPVILRMLGTASARRLFVGSMTVAMLTLALARGFGLNGEGALWIGMGHALVVLIFFAPLGAAAAIVVGPDRETLPKRAVTAVFLGSGVATATLLIAHWPDGESLSIGLAMTPFYVTLFAVLFALSRDRREDGAACATRRDVRSDGGGRRGAESR